MERMTMRIDGMSCGHCVGQVQKALAQLVDVQVEEVAIGAATVRYDPQAMPKDRITRAVEERGYTVTSTTG